MALDFDRFLDERDPSVCRTNYGSYMLTTSLADWAELMSLQGCREPWPVVVDGMLDSMSQRIYSPSMTGMGLFNLGEIDNEEDEEEDLGDAVKSILEYRSRVLKDRYPFCFDAQNCFSLKKGFVLNKNPYTVLLMLSLLKGWESDKKAHQVCYRLFEHITKEAFICEGFSAALMGTAAKGGFRERIGRVGIELGIRVNPDACSRPKMAKDDGVDVVIAKLFRDDRKGEVFILVQATCGKDTEWSKKLNSTPSGRWRQYLIAQLTPLCVLSVPYHVSSDEEERLLGVDAARTFVDRVRLAKMLPQELPLANTDADKEYHNFKAYVSRYFDLDI